ncbi:hypothetical protein EXN66_Car007854 [Channa argus]|uniref:Uncharacterized protein n=1 Tax=Channa argus TaxID=215402 RepID=A0A6G1PQC0_CHAAH|nr:hypothetical protein EXN66_Car007854 [Channa argus]
MRQQQWHFTGSLVKKQLLLTLQWFEGGLPSLKKRNKTYGTVSPKTHTIETQSASNCFSFTHSYSQITHTHRWRSLGSNHQPGLDGRLQYLLCHSRPSISTPRWQRLTDSSNLPTA